MNALTAPRLLPAIARRLDPAARSAAEEVVAQGVLLDRLDKAGARYRIDVDFLHVNRDVKGSEPWRTATRALAAASLSKHGARFARGGVVTDLACGAEELSKVLTVIAALAQGNLGPALALTSEWFGTHAWFRAQTEFSWDQVPAGPGLYVMFDGGPHHGECVMMRTSAGLLDEVTLRRRPYPTSSRPTVNLFPEGCYSHDQDHSRDVGGSVQSVTTYRHASVLRAGQLPARLAPGEIFDGTQECLVVGPEAARPRLRLVR